MWGLRERLVEAQLREGVVYKVCLVATGINLNIKTMDMRIL